MLILKKFALIFCASIFLCLACQKKSETVFEFLPSEQTNLTFTNEITESDSFNILESEFIYNGGGVAIGDLNGDGWEDIFLTGNQVNNALYLNEGDFKFRDITKVANVGKTDTSQWSSGVNILDLNLDGKLDIYVCNTLQKDSTLRRNLLYINQGNQEDGIPVFKEMAAAYGIDDPSHSSHAQFFDYDNDGDLDLFVGVNLIEDKYPNQFIELVNDGSAPNRDNLFQNNWSESLGHPVFTDVSLAAGLLQDGYSHSTLIYDFNEDGWQDIYVANDYQSNDLIFINNQNGTFTNQAGKIFKHFSMSAMGSDVGDINNDGKGDFFVSEMQPYYNKRKKLFQGGSSYQNQILTEQYDYEYQYTRNTLQLNQGNNPVTGLPIFSEIGMYAKVQETDWSWATLFADFDNDGWQDLYIANGFPRDVTDRDFSDFRATVSNLITKEELYEAIPEVKSPNFLFRNTGNLQFENVTKDWGLDIPSFSNGAAYADLDQDGDLDIIVNNIDDPAFIIENRSAAKDNNYLRIKLVGNEKNPDAFGSSVTLFHDGKQQTQYLLSSRGYLSKSENTLHFGLGATDIVDSIHIKWAGGQKSYVNQIAINQLLVISYQEFQKDNHFSNDSVKPLFAIAADQYNLNYTHQAKDFIDFNIQRTLPHKFSQYGPAMSIADINGDQLDDILFAGSKDFEQYWMIQQADGTFQKQTANYKTATEQEDAALLLFDADADGDNDLYIARGSGQYKVDSEWYQDVFYENDGKGNFLLNDTVLPEMRSNSSCVKGADIDKDGDIDLFVGSRVLPHAYPFPDRSYLLRNDSQNGQIKFTDVTAQLAPDLLKPGLISDAIWTDFDNDTQVDLLLAGEWMPIRAFKNTGGKFKDITEESGLLEKSGWWNSLIAVDLDQDGDMDYVAGNFGENIYFQCNSDQPIRVYGNDWDKNGTIDPLISCYWQDSMGVKKEFLYHPREDLIKQFVGIRKKYNTYGEYGEATVKEMFSEEELKDATVLSANWMKSSIIENKGNGQFEMRALPLEAQFAPIYGILAQDIDEDGQMDILLVGNDYGMEVQQGRADAFMGLVLLNRGDWQFEVLDLERSNFGVFGDAKALGTVLVQNNKPLVLATQHRAELHVFESTSIANTVNIRLRPEEVKAVYDLKNGKTRVEEFYWGSGFITQSSRYVTLNDAVEKIELFDHNGVSTRVVTNEAIQ